MLTIYIVTIMVYLKAKYLEEKAQAPTEAVKESLLSPAESPVEGGEDAKKEELGCFSFWKTAVLLSLVLVFGIGVFVIQLFYISG